MKKLFVLASLVAVGLFLSLPLFLVQAATPRQAQAAEPPRLGEAHLALWPEYDDPSLLVIVVGTLPQGTPLPVTLRLLMPTGAVLNAAAYEGEGGTLVHANPSQKASATTGWDEVSFEVNNPVFQFEYYHNAIKGGPDKSISFDYRFLYPIDDLTVEAQQPLRATNFAIKPETQSISTRDSFRYYQFRFTQVEANRALPLEIRYTKADTEPSVPLQAPQTPAATPAETGTNWTTIGLLIGGMAIFAAFLWVVIRRRAEPVEARRATGMAPAPPRRGTASPPTAAQQRRGAAGASRARPNFCPNCGQELVANANFCPRCGEKVG